MFLKKKLRYSAIKECKLVVPFLPDQDRELKVLLQIDSAPDSLYRIRTEVSAGGILRTKVRATLVADE